MADIRGRAPITKKDLRDAKKRAKLARAAKMKSEDSSGAKAGVAKSSRVKTSSSPRNKGRMGVGFGGNTKLYIIIGICVIVAVIVGMTFYIATQRQPGEEELLVFVESGVYANTTTIQGVDVSGKTIAEARVAISPALEKKFFETTIKYKVNGEEFSKTAIDLDLVTDIEDILIDAMLYEKTGNVFDRSEKLKELETSGQSFEVDLIANADMVAKAAKVFLPAHGELPVEPTMTFNPDGTTTDDYFEWTDHKNGFAVNEAAFVQLAVSSINSDNFDLGEIEVDVLESNKTKEMMQETVVKLSEYTTFYGTGDLDDKNRMANIKKMGDMVSGTVIKPGQTWSLNDTTGERTEDDGWEYGHAIKRGAVVDELGGGVCQVSGTLYNAFLEADLGIVERNNHTVMSVYIDRKSREEYYPNHEAADATIDYPRKDLKVKNTYDEDVYIIVITDTDREVENITAMVFGPKPENDYKIVIRTIEETDESKIPKPTADTQLLVAENGIAPGGTYVSVGAPYTYVKRKDGSVWYTYKYYYPATYDPEVDPTYSWIGYVEGDNKSGEKYRIKTVDSGEYLDSIYPAQNGVVYYHPDDPLSYGLPGSTYDPNAAENQPDESGGETETPAV